MSAGANCAGGRHCASRFQSGGTCSIERTAPRAAIKSRPPAAPAAATFGDPEVDDPRAATSPQRDTEDHSPANSNMVAPRVAPAWRPAPQTAVGAGRQQGLPTGWMIGGGVVVLLLLAALILKPPSEGGDDVAKPVPVATNAPAPPPRKSAPPVEPKSDDNEFYEPGGPPETAEPSKPPVKPERPKPRPKPVPRPAPSDDPVMVAQRPPENDNPSNVDPAKSAAFRQAMAQVRGLLGAREVEEAKKKLAASKPLVASDDNATELARTELLADYVGKFWDGVRESLKSLQVTDELRYGGMVAAVVASDTSGITLHTPGKNHEFTLKNMPVALAMTLAQRWFDQSPANKLMLGAFQAVDPQGSREEARQFWESATAGGASAEDLMPLLSGTAIQPGGSKAATPALNERQQAVALKQIKATFQGEYKAAQTPELKADLGKKMLNLAAESEDSAERFALLREALELAAAGGSPLLIGEAADQLASNFQVDSLELKADGLSRAANATNNAGAAREIARSALALLDGALQEKRAKPAGKLGQAALNAARKAKDAELVKAANAGNQKAQELTK